MSDFVSVHFPHDCVTAVQTANDVIDLTMIDDDAQTISAGRRTECTMVNIVLFYHLFQMHLFCNSFTPGTLDKDSARSSSRLQVGFQQCSRCTLASYFFSSLEPVTYYWRLSFTQTVEKDLSVRPLAARRHAQVLAVKTKRKTMPQRVKPSLKKSKCALKWMFQCIPINLVSNWYRSCTRTAALQSPSPRGE